MLCDSSNLHKQKLVKPKPLASKMAAVKKVEQKNGEVGLLVEYLFYDITDLVDIQRKEVISHFGIAQETW